MRIFPVVLLALLVSGCAAPAGQAIDSSVSGSAEQVGIDETGAGSNVSPTMSLAGRALLEQGRGQRLAGEYVQASATLERALRVEPQQPAIWLELGELRFEEGNLPQAEQMARKALSLSPEGSRAHQQALRLIEDARRAAGR